jgi:hypothetical protein
MRMRMRINFRLNERKIINMVSRSRREG